MLSIYLLASLLLLFDIEESMPTLPFGHGEGFEELRSQKKPFGQGIGSIVPGGQ